MPKFKLVGKVFKDSQEGYATLASGSCVKEAESAEALREAWEHDMKIAFPMGADYNVEYHCKVEPVDAEPIGVADHADRSADIDRWIATLPKDEQDRINRYAGRHGRLDNNDRPHEYMCPYLPGPYRQEPPAWVVWCTIAVVVGLIAFFGLGG